MNSQMRDAMQRAGIGRRSSKGKGKSKPTPQAPVVTDVSPVFKGTVKFFNLREGYGFITDEEGKEHFVHYSQISRGKKFLGLDKGDVVEFQVNADSSNRQQAVAVRIIDDDGSDNIESSEKKE